MKRLFNWFLLLFCVVYGIKNYAQTTTYYQPDSTQHYTKYSEFEKAQAYLNQFDSTNKNVTDSIRVIWLIDKSQVYNAQLQNKLTHFYLEKAQQSAKTQQLDTLYNLATIHLMEWNRKGRFYDNALHLYHQIKNSPHLSPYLKARLYHRIAAVYNELGVIQENQSYFDSSIYYSNKSLAISVPHQFYDHQICSYIELGSIHKYLKNSHHSIQYLKQAASKCKSYNTNMYINALRNIGVVFIDLNQPDSAIQYLQLALSQPILANDYFLKTDIYRSLKRAYKLDGDSINYLKSTVQQEKFRALGIEKQLNNTVHELAIKYEAQQKDDLIALRETQIQQEQQNKKVSIIISVLLAIIALASMLFYWFTRKRNLVLKQLNIENQFLTHEANHRIKNNLQLITSLIGRDIHKSTNPEQLQELSHKINAIATLHQQLYLKEQKQNIDVAMYINSIVKHLQQSTPSDHIKFTVICPPIELPIEQSTHIGLLINELITNSIKHAFNNELDKAHNAIKIQLTQNKQILTLHYSDNGVGLSNHQQPSLVQILVRQIKGQIIPISEKGYQLKIQFSL